MSIKKYAFEIRFLQMFFFPPWSMYKIVSDRKVKQKKNTGIFLMIWVILQWLLFLTIGTNLIMGFIYSNLAIAIFFLLNIYVGLDMNEISEGEKKLLHSMPLKFTVTVTTLLIMYSIPNMLSKIYSHANIGFLSNTISWSSFHIVSAAVLVISWLIFMFVDKYEIFALFPKTEFKERLYQFLPITSERLALIYFMYIFLFICFFIYGYIL
jgi:hypothetical protein